MDLYKILGVERSATEDEIKTAYRKKAFDSHPDRNPGDPDADKKFKEIQEAYDTLSDPLKKAQYDRTPIYSGRPHARPFGGIWDNIFGAAPPHVQERGKNIHLTLEIELIDVVNGLVKKSQIPQRARCNKCEANGFTEFKACPICHGSGKSAIKQPPFNIWMSCSACRGSGRAGHVVCDDCKGDGFITTGQLEVAVTIPPGVDTGHQVRIQGYGEPSKFIDGKSGDLNIIIIVKEHKLFKRHGVNLTYDFPVGFSDLCLGTQVEIPTLTGSTLLTIPPNTKDLTQFRMKMLGVPHISGGKGDLIVVAKLILPSSDKIGSNMEILEKFREFEKSYLNEERNRLK
jgi:molecular chaperone DnaJ